MSHQVVTITQAEATAAEEATDARIAAAAFQPGPPLQAPPAAYAAGTTYASGATVMDGATAYRSVVAGNKANTPHEDDGTHWVPFPFTLAAPLQNPNYNHAPSAGAGLGE